MYNLKNVLGLPVLSLYEGELVGSVTKINFNEKLGKVLSISIAGEGDITYTIMPKYIYKIGKNAITIKNNACLSFDSLELETAYPIGFKTYTIQGEYLGKIDQITFNEKFFVDTIVLDNGKTMSPANLFSCGKNTVIIHDENTKLSPSHFRQKFTPKFFKSKLSTKVTTLPITPNTDDKKNEEDLLIDIPSIQNPSSKVEITESTAGAKTNGSKFLVGRIALQTILLDDKTTLIKANSTITEKVIRLACTHNKLKELMTYSKQK